jgi:hypothetical protein
MKTDDVRRSDLFRDVDHRGVKGKGKTKNKVKVAGTRPGRRHPFDWPLKRMQKPAELLLILAQPTLSRFPSCVTDSARRPLGRRIVRLISFGVKR